MFYIHSKYIYNNLFALFVFCLSSFTVSAQQWDTLVGFNAPSSEVWTPHMTFYNNMAYVAFQGGFSGSQSCMIAQSNAWDTLGTATMTSSDETEQFVAIDNNGTPYMAYIAADDANRVKVISYQNNSWQSVGTLSTDDLAYHPSLIFDQNNNLYLAYSYTDDAIPVLPKPKSKLHKYSGGQWTACATTLEGQFVSMAMTADNSLYLAYNHNSGLSSLDGLSAKMYNVGLDAFQSVGSAPIAAAGMAKSVCLAADSLDLYIAFADSLQNDKASVMKFDGTAWTYLGNAGITGGAVSTLSMVLKMGTPYLAFDDSDQGGKVSVMQYDSSAWSNFGAAGLSAGAAESVSLVQDNNDLYLAYKDNGLSGTLALMKYYLSVNTDLISSLEHIVTVYPNPVHNILQIQTDLNVHKIVLTDELGRCIRTTFDRQMSMDLVKSGFYILQIYTDKGLIVKKVIKS